MKPMFLLWLFWFFMWLIAVLVHLISSRRGPTKLAEVTLWLMWGFVACMWSASLVSMVAA